jgi:phosphatidylglycerol:prolipoprotein diacylglycerol transferase
MHPKLLEIGGFFLPSYGFLLALAYLSAITLMVRMARKEGMDDGKVMDLGLYVLVSALLGSKLMAVALDWRHFWENPADLKSILRVGGVFYGGFLAAVLVGGWHIRRHGLPLRRVFDIGAVAMPLGMAVGRVGCLAAGCCWGAPVPPDSNFWSVTFTDADAHAFTGVPLNVPLHPVQAYLSVTSLLMIGLMWILRRRRPYPGWAFGWFLVAAGASRFLLEYLRDDPRGHFLGLPFSTSQGISLLLILAALPWFWWAKRTADKEAAAA